MDASSAHRETTRLGSYEILRKLTRGGMAEIFLARTSGPSGFEKLVVLKKILSKYAGNQRYVQLFLEEAKLAASLDHPNIAQVYDIGMVDGSYFFAMEYLHGQDVRSMLHRAWRIGARFPVEHAVQVARNVASALHFAHEKRRNDGTLLGLVHRDVSPSNIIVTYDGATKLLDFGVAKTAASTVKTRTGALKGKIAYMSPEQARGAPVDRRSDLFSLGIVLWEMITTQRLYRADNDLATLQLIIHHPPRPPSQLVTDCPAELERIVLRALAQNPADRYPDAAQLVNDLDELAREHKLHQSPNALAGALGQLFGAEVAAWREAQAAGVSLAEHLAAISQMTSPISESDFIDLAEPVDAAAGSDPEAADAEPGDLADEAEPEHEPDEPDPDDDDDDDLTEHAAPIIDVLSPLAGETLIGAPRPLVGDGMLAEPRMLEAQTLVGDPRVLADAPSTVTLTTLPPTGTVPTLTEPGAPVPVSHGVPAELPRATPAAVPVVSARMTPSGPLPVVSRSPYAVPAWQTGQPPAPSPAAPSGERVGRSWSVIDLPAFDPEMFARQRRLVLRIAAGLLGVVILLAVIAGHC